MTREELINKIRNNRSFGLRASEFYEPWDISDETIKDMADDFYYLLKDVLNYLVGKEEPVSEDLWEASKQYALRQVFASTDEEMSEQAYLDLRLFSGLELAVAHKDGAQWQKQKNESKVLTEEQCRKIRDDAFELGKDAMKQKMMANAVDGVVVCNMLTHGYKDIVMKIPSFINVGDKVKVIVIKED